MELRRAADALLRSQASPLATTINPRSTIRWSSKAQSTYTCCSNRPAQRYLTTTTRLDAVKQNPTTSARPPQSAGAQPPKNPMDALGSSLGWTSHIRASRPSLPKASSKLALEKKLNGGDSASDLLSSLSLRNRRRDGPPTSTQGSGMDVSKMLDPFSSVDNGSFMQGAMQDLIVPKTKRAPMKLGPSTGRSITIGATIDVGRGFRLLEMSCARNKVRSDANKQRFHERGGLKRKRLRRERWRRRFMDGFKATVGRVKQLKNQGW